MLVSSRRSQCWKSSAKRNRGAKNTVSEGESSRMARFPQPAASALKATFVSHHYPHSLRLRRGEAPLILRPPIGFGVLGDAHGLVLGHLAPGHERGEAERTQDGFDLGDVQLAPRDGHADGVSSDSPVIMPGE